MYTINARLCTLMFYLITYFKYLSSKATTIHQRLTYRTGILTHLLNSSGCIPFDQSESGFFDRKLDFSFHFIAIRS